MHARPHSLRLDPKLVAIGLGGGLLSGLLGVGGGIVMVPLLVLWAAYSQRDAHAISLGAIIPISIAGIATYGVAGEVRYGTAIALAFREAGRGDTVVIAGKGHEQGQEFEGGRKVPFDDREVAREELRRLLA